MTYFTVLVANFLCRSSNKNLSWHRISWTADSSYIGMPITRSTHLDQIYVYQFGLTNRVIADFLPDEFPKASSPVSSHQFNNVWAGQKYDGIKYLSLIMTMMYKARLSRQDILLLARCLMGIWRHLIMTAIAILDGYGKWAHLPYLGCKSITDFGLKFMNQCSINWLVIWECKWRWR